MTNPSTSTTSSRSIPWPAQDWRRALVYGLGISGRAAVALLRRRGVSVLVMDEGTPDEAQLADFRSDDGVELRLGQRPETLPEGIDGVVVSPGVPLDRPLLQAARAAGVPVLAEVELAFPLLDGPVIGITGSNGKSTTTALAGAMLATGGHRVEVCGNIGEALSSRVSEMTGEAPGRVFVVELSSFQLEATQHFHPRAAALLNLTPDHLDRHPDFEAYRDAKASIFRRQEADDLAVLNAGDALVCGVPTASQRRYFTAQESLGDGVMDGCRRLGEAVVEVTPGQSPRTLFRPDGCAPARACTTSRTPWRRRYWRVTIGVEAGDHRRRPARFSRSTPPPRVGGRTSRRALVRRFQGHQPGGHRALPRRLWRRHRAFDLGRHLQGGRPRRIGGHGAPQGQAAPT